MQGLSACSFYPPVLLQLYIYDIIYYTRVNHD